MHALRPAAVRYIKLGPQGRWFDRCRREGLIELGHNSVPHHLAQVGDWTAIERLLVETQGRSSTKATDFVREIRDFYTLGANCIWITIAEGRLWWAVAEPVVFPISGDDRGARARRVIGAWRDTDLAGGRLDISGLSTRLTKTAAYRQTICSVAAEDYLLRRLNGEAQPAVATATQARADLLLAARALIELLDWRDFEILVDLIFAGSGWRRVSEIGGDQADTDMILEQAVTGERAFVQVKSSASAAVLKDYIARFRADARFDRLFFICHSPAGALVGRCEPGVHLWLGDRLAEQAVRAGLLDWLIAKTR